MSYNCLPTAVAFSVATGTAFVSCGVLDVILIANASGWSNLTLSEGVTCSGPGSMVFDELRNEIIVACRGRDQQWPFIAIDPHTMSSRYIQEVDCPNAMQVLADPISSNVYFSCQGARVPNPVTVMRLDSNGTVIALANATSCFTTGLSVQAGSDELLLLCEYFFNNIAVKSVNINGGEPVTTLTAFLNTNYAQLAQQKNQQGQSIVYAATRTNTQNIVEMQCTGTDQVEASVMSEIDPLPDSSPLL